MQSSSRLLNSGFGLSYCLLPKENILWASKEMKGIRLDLQAWVLQHLKGALSDWSVFLLPHYPHHTFMCFPTHLACCAIVFQYLTWAAVNQGDSKDLNSFHSKNFTCQCGDFFFVFLLPLLTRVPHIFLMLHQEKWGKETSNIWNRKANLS